MIIEAFIGTTTSLRERILKNLLKIALKISEVFFKETIKNFNLVNLPYGE